MGNYYPRKFSLSRFMELYNSGLVDSEIADTLGVTQQCVIHARERLELESNHVINKRKLHEKMKDHHENQCSDCRIAKKLNVGRGKVIRWRKRNNLPANYNGRVPVRT